MFFKKKSDNEAPPPSKVKDVETREEHFFKDIEIEFLIHELKDPLAIIETGLRTLLSRGDKYGPLSDRQEKTLRRVLRNAIKAREMVNGLLETGRSEAGCFFPCRFFPVSSTFTILMDTIETADSALLADIDRDGMEETALIRHLAQKGIHFYISPETIETEMYQDETKYRQIVGNLVKNALHYKSERIEIKMNHRGDALCVEVADDGPGIDLAHHETIFKRYTQLSDCVESSRKGHGLGLAGARIMARCMGGDIFIDSQKGKGAIFKLHLPIRYQKAVQ